MQSQKRRHSPALLALSGGIVVLWLFLAAFPFLWTAWGSFKVEADFFSRTDWLNAIYGPKTIAQTGGPFTGDGYHGAWVLQQFWVSAANTIIVTLSVVVISLTSCCSRTGSAGPSADSVPRSTSWNSRMSSSKCCLDRSESLSG